MYVRVRFLIMYVRVRFLLLCTYGENFLSFTTVKINSGNFSFTTVKINSGNFLLRSNITFVFPNIADKIFPTPFAKTRQLPRLFPYPTKSRKRKRTKIPDHSQITIARPWPILVHTWPNNGRCRSEYNSDVDLPPLVVSDCSDDEEPADGDFVPLEPRRRPLEEGSSRALFPARAAWHPRAHQAPQGGTASVPRCFVPRRAVRACAHRALLLPRRS
jgi:hypothetical protein